MLRLPMHLVQELNASTVYDSSVFVFQSGEPLEEEKEEEEEEERTKNIHYENIRRHRLPNTYDSAVCQWFPLHA